MFIVGFDSASSLLVEFSANGSPAISINPTVDGKTFSTLRSVSLDSVGDLFISDYGNNRVVEIQQSHSPVSPRKPRIPEIPPFRNSVPPEIPPREVGFHDSCLGAKRQKPLIFKRLTGTH
jgi:hypothetical protein